MDSITMNLHLIENKITIFQLRFNIDNKTEILKFRKSSIFKIIEIPLRNQKILELTQHRFSLK